MYNVHHGLVRSFKQTKKSLDKILTLIAKVLTKDLQILHPVEAVSGVVRLERQPLRTGDNLKDERRREGERVRLM